MLISSKSIWRIALVAVLSLLISLLSATNTDLPILEIGSDIIQKIPLPLIANYPLPSSTRDSLSYLLPQAYSLKHRQTLPTQLVQQGPYISIGWDSYEGLSLQSYYYPSNSIFPRLALTCDVENPKPDFDAYQVKGSLISKLNNKLQFHHVLYASGSHTESSNSTLLGYYLANNYDSVEWGDFKLSHIRTRLSIEHLERRPASGFVPGFSHQHELSWKNTMLFTDLQILKSSLGLSL